MEMNALLSKMKKKKENRQENHYLFIYLFIVLQNAIDVVEKYNHVCQYKFVEFIALLRLFSILYIDCMHIAQALISYAKSCYMDGAIFVSTNGAKCIR